MNKADFISGIKSRLSYDLPGIEAQKVMMAMPDNKFRFDYTAREDAKESGVLILLYKDHDDWRFPLILRPDYKGAHSGQVALPGGRRESHDDDIVHTALRETSEEIGVRQTDIQILGTLTELFIPVSNYLVFPTVGFVDYVPEWIPEKREVEKVFSVNVDQLTNPASIKKKNIQIQGVAVTAPYFDFGNEFVWGATAMILHEFRTLLRVL